MKRFKKWMIPYITLSTLPLLVTAFIYPKMPERIFYDYRFRDASDNLVTKNILFLFPIIIFVFAFIRLNNIRESNTIKIPKGMLAIAFSLLFILNVSVYIRIYASYYSREVFSDNLIWYINIVFGITFLIIGNYLPKLKQNDLFGIINKYTLSSDNTWNKTHRKLGKGFIIIGGLILTLNFFIIPSVATLIFLIGLGVIYLRAMKFSYVEYLKTQN